MLKLKITPRNKYEGKIYFCPMTSYNIIIERYIPTEEFYECLYIRKDGTTTSSTVSSENIINNIFIKHWILIN